jgi:dCMP deaminase
MAHFDAGYYMAMAELVASKSKDPRRKVGAVLISPDQRLLSTGYNGFPSGIKDTADRLDNKDLKNAFMVHAELNAILNCPTRPEAWTLVVNRHPCRACALAIIQAGIRIVICPEPVDPSLDKLETFAQAEMLFHEARVRLVFEGQAS